MPEALFNSWSQHSQSVKNLLLFTQRGEAVERCGTPSSSGSTSPLCSWLVATVGVATDVLLVFFSIHFSVLSVRYQILAKYKYVIIYIDSYIEIYNYPLCRHQTMVQMVLRLGSKRTTFPSAAFVFVLYMGFSNVAWPLLFSWTEHPVYWALSVFLQEKGQVAD